MHKLLIALAVGAAALAAPAAAAVLSVSTQIVGPNSFTFFAGTPAQSSLTVNACPGFFNCVSSIDVTQGVPVQGTTHYDTLASVGAGVENGAPLIADFSIDLVYTIAGQTVSLTQAGRYQRINNYQFQIQFFESGTQTLDLGALGLLDVTALGTASQVLQFTGGSGPVRTRFLLHDVPPAVPEPASWAMMILGFGFTGAALRRRRGCRLLAKTAMLPLPARSPSDG